MKRLGLAAIIVATAMTPSFGIAWTLDSGPSTIGDPALGGVSFPSGGSGWKKLRSGVPEEDYQPWLPGSAPTDVSNPLFQGTPNTGVNPLWGQ